MFVILCLSVSFCNVGCWHVPVLGPVAFAQGSKKKKKKIARVKRAVLLTLQFVDPEIKNSELANYFRMYGNVTKVVHEYYKEAKFTQVKTGRRLVFIELFEGCHPPPF